MVNDSIIAATIETDRALGDILANFSDDYIDNMVEESLRYKFRPYATRLPNHPYLLEQNFINIINHYNGDSTEIKERRYAVYENIINDICATYNLQIGTDIPYEAIYSLVYVMYQIFVSEFSDRMINFYSQYIFNNADNFISAIPEEQRSQKTNYAKKIYSEDSVDDTTSEKYITIYDNMDAIIDMVIPMDIPFYDLLVMLSDQNTADFITSYIIDTGDIYKNHFATYLMMPNTKIDMITSIKLKVVAFTMQNASLLNPEKNPIFTTK